MVYYHCNISLWLIINVFANICKQVADAFWRDLEHSLQATALGVTEDALDSGDAAMVGHLLHCCMNVSMKESMLTEDVFQLSFSTLPPLVKCILTMVVLLILHGAPYRSPCASSVSSPATP